MDFRIQVLNPQVRKIGHPTPKRYSKKKKMRIATEYTRTAEKRKNKLNLCAVQKYTK